MIILDDEIKVRAKSDCMQCKYFVDDFDINCPAFPNGIPPEIRLNKVKHRTVRPDQTGDTVFESILTKKDDSNPI